MHKERVVVIRQRPSIGDALLLAPLVSCLKVRHPNSDLTVITEGDWCSGALRQIFSNIPGVDRVECVSVLEWTTDAHKELDPNLRTANGDVPVTVKKAEHVYDCNSAFIEMERANHGAASVGISEFWVSHFGFDPSTTDLRPKYTVPEDDKNQIEDWIRHRCTKAPLVGVVLRAGHTARDWNHGGLANMVVEWLYTRGYQPVTIDPIRSLGSQRSVGFVGRQINEVAALLTKCVLVVTPDTGILHLAEAVRTPTVALWGIMEPHLRISGYQTTLVPKQSLGYCEGSDEKQCQCLWKFQRWSCLRRLRPLMVTEGIEEALVGIQRKQPETCGHHGDLAASEH